MSFDWQGELGSGTSRAQLYALDYALDLFSNFSYYTDAANGDQFEQLDERRVYGGAWDWQGASFDVLGAEQRLMAGLQVRHDDIGQVGLYRTIERQRFATVREDAVRQTSLSAFTSVDDALERDRCAPPLACVPTALLLM